MFAKLLENDRHEFFFFNSYWSVEKSIYTKRKFIISCVENYCTARSRKRGPNLNKCTESTLGYFLL